MSELTPHHCRFNAELSPNYHLIDSECTRIRGQKDSPRDGKLQKEVRDYGGSPAPPALTTLATTHVASCTTYECKKGIHPDHNG